MRKKILKKKNPKLSVLFLGINIFNKKLLHYFPVYSINLSNWLCIYIQYGYLATNPFFRKFMLFTPLKLISISIPGNFLFIKSTKIICVCLLSITVCI